MNDRGARLLVADDNKVNRLLLGRNLELQGHRVVQAEDGAAALGRLRQEPFDLVLLDMEMPEMSGFEVLERMQADPALRDIPVIVTSALEGEAHVVRCLELGAEDVLGKPVNPVILRARIGGSLERKRLRDQLKAQVGRFAATEVAQDLEASGFAMRAERREVTVLFVDIRGFTSLAERQSPEETIDLLNAYYTLMFEAVAAQGGVINQITGDGLMALFGAPRPLSDAALRATRCASEMLDMIDLLNVDRGAAGSPALRIGVGIATGEVIAAATRHIHLRRRHGERRGEAGDAYPRRRARRADGRGHPAGLAGRHRRQVPGARNAQGQARAGGGLRAVEVTGGPERGRVARRRVRP